MCMWIPLPSSPPPLTHNISSAPAPPQTRQQYDIRDPAESDAMDRLVLQLNHLSDRLLMVAAGQGGQGEAKGK